MGTKKQKLPEIIESPRCTAWVDFGQSFGRVHCAEYEHKDTDHTASVVVAVSDKVNARGSWTLHGTTVKLAWQDSPDTAKYAAELAKYAVPSMVE